MDFYAFELKLFTELRQLAEKRSWYFDVLKHPKGRIFRGGGNDESKSVITISFWNLPNGKSATWKLPIFAIDLRKPKESLSYFEWYFNINKNNPENGTPQETKQIIEKIDKMLSENNIPAVEHRGYNAYYSLRNFNAESVFEQLPTIISDIVKINELMDGIPELKATRYKPTDFQDQYLKIEQRKTENPINSQTEKNRNISKFKTGNTLNRILYGPPGTGKTYFTTRCANEILFNDDEDLTLEELKEKLRKSSSALKEPDYNELSWGDVVLLAFKGKENEHVSVTDIRNADYIQGKAKFQARNKNITATIWGHLQRDAKLDSKTVNFSKRSNKEYFDKDEKSRWFLTQQGKEALAELSSKSPSQDESSQIEFVTFHPSFSYEDFVEGFRPSFGGEDSDQAGGIELRDGIFKKICLRAKLNDTKKYVLIIDEINRANISKVFGELITLIEDDKRIGNKNEIKIKLPYSQEEFGVPSNLYLIGTMNSTDKSIALVDVALRRRFKFIRRNPDYSKIDDPDARKFLENLNEKIIALKGEDFQIGHSCLMHNRGTHLNEVVRDEILPLLEEYFYNDFDRLGTILGKDCIERKETKLLEYDDGKKEPSESGSQWYSILRRNDVQKMIEHVLGKAKQETQPES